MDTKLKNYKYSPWTKFIAVIMFLVMIFSSSFFAAISIKSVLFYDVSEKNTYTDTGVFYTALKRYLPSLSSYAIYDSANLSLESNAFLEYVQQRRTRLEELKQDLLLNLEIVKNASFLNENEISTDEQTEIEQFLETEFYETTDNENQEQGFEVTTEFDNSNTKKAYSQQEYSYALASLHDHGFNERSTQQEISDYFDLMANDTSSFFREYAQSANSASGKLEEIENLKFAVVDMETGEVFSNFIQEHPENTSLESYFAKDSWTMVFSRDSGIIINGKIGSFLHNSGSSYAIISDYSIYNSLENIMEENYYSKGYELYLGLPEELQHEDIFSFIKDDFEKTKANLWNNIILSVLFLALAFALFVFLVAVCGRKTDKSLSISPIDRIYNDLHLLISLLLIAGLAVVLYWMSTEVYYLLSTPYYANMLKHFKALNNGLLAFSALLITAFSAVLLELILSIARNIKNQRYFKNTLVYKLFKLPNKLKKIVLSTFKNLSAKHLKELKKTVIYFTFGYFGVNLVLFLALALNLNYNSFLLFLLFFFITLVFNLCVFYIVYSFLKSLDTLMSAVDMIQKGHFDVRLDIMSLPAPLRKMGSDVLSSQEGMKRAINTAVKGERMKAELITNVSHDLKTPLTSIVNYVDLLDRCNLQDETANEYIGILKEKAQRLKRLIEDLTEASKASTGNLKLNPTKVNLYEIALQLAGEHSDTLEKNNIEIIMNEPENAPIIFADSQQTWRIIDNLFSNIEKYAMPNTRVYIEIFENETFGVFTIKNISHAPLNIEPEELTQRFVRGNEARGGEGSGLGLSIAKSLCEMQRGRFVLEIDGDLFKASVMLPKA